MQYISLLGDNSINLCSAFLNQANTSTKDLLSKGPNLNAILYLV